jgi:carboxypeptidase Taq
MHELKDLSSAIGLLAWDQETFMPPRAAQSRAEQLSTLQALYHERLTDPRLGEQVQQLAQSTALDPAQAASVRNLARERARAEKLPVELVRELAEAQSTSVEVWKRARAERNFSLFAPHVEKLVALRQKQADLWGHTGERYDALLEAYEPGMRTARLEPLFAALRSKLVPLVQAIAGSKKKADLAFLSRGRWDLAKQDDFTLFLLRQMGFDFESGRQDKSTHPFSSGANVNDVRLTNRYHEDNPFSAIFSALHEGGHGLYEQGFDPKLHRTFASSAPSMGLHESQSRLWENLIGRSKPFWLHHGPLMRQRFPELLKDVADGQLYAAVNHVEPSLIRVEADEVTYNLHILLRFELELALVRGQLKARDLPGAWNERMRDYLGVTPPHDGVGVLQDIHWSWGEFGYFPTYTLGNLYSVCILEAAERSMPALWSDVERGQLLGLREWLRAHVHAHGFVFGAEELVQRETGQALSEAPFVRYLWRKYGELYEVKPAA